MTIFLFSSKNASSIYLCSKATLLFFVLHRLFTEFCLYFLTDEAYTASKTFILFFFVLHCVWPSLLHLVVGEVVVLWIESKTTAASIGALSTSCKIRHTVRRDAIFQVLMTHKYHFEAIVGPGVGEIEA
ncbi:hypothetical protein VNO77_37898 [Canavalia gladiata]|uniref:Uncharacterized protein n=1 Tax=Canavalia gladiata TaxID=3824 RepID=A0AAN9K8L8_CANGL